MTPSVVGSQPPHCVNPFPCLSKEQNPTQQCPRQTDRLKISVRGTRTFHSFGSMRTQCGKNLFKVNQHTAALLLLVQKPLWQAWKATTCRPNTATPCQLQASTAEPCAWAGDHVVHTDENVYCLFLHGERKGNC